MRYSVRCTRASCLLSLLVFWSCVTLFHFSSPDDLHAITSVLFASPSDPHAQSQSHPSSPQSDDDSPPGAAVEDIARSLESFKSSPVETLPACNFSTTAPELLWAVSGGLRESEWEGFGVKVSVELRCLPLERSPPRAAFRVYTTGSTMTALPPSSTVMDAGRRLTHFWVRMLDTGEGSVHVKLALYNASEDLVSRSWPPGYVPRQEELGSRWVDRPIHGSPLNYTLNQSVTAYPYLMRADLTPALASYAALTDIAAYVSSPLPICNARREARGSLAGRWLLGPPHPHITRQWWSDSIFDDYAPRWAPYDCRLDYSASLQLALRKVRWLNVVGDSNMRALFMRLCEVSKGDAWHGDPAVSYMDLPKLCVLDEGRTVLTFSNYFYDKKMPLHAHQSFREQCGRYNDSLAAIKQHDTIFGWPDCHRADESIQQLTSPGLLYFGWGSHVAELGDGDTMDVFLKRLAPMEYFALTPTVFALIEDVDSSMIPDKFGAQFVYRNNERIHAVNKRIVDLVERQWDQWPIDVVDKAGKDVTGFFPVLDVFSPTHAASEVLHGDAVHFWSEFENEIVRWLTHWITHAPQLDTDYRRKPQPPQRTQR